MTTPRRTARPSESAETGFLHSLEHITLMMAEIDQRYAQRWEASAREINIRFQSIDQNFVAAEKAVNVALIAAEKAVNVSAIATEKAVNAAFAAAKEAVQKAEMAADKRFEGMNEFRGQLQDQANTFMTRAESVARMQAFEDKLSGMKESSDKRDGQTGGLGVAWLIVVAVVGLLFSGVMAYGVFAPRGNYVAPVQRMAVP